MRCLFFFSVFALCMGCSPDSLSDYRAEGEALCLAFTEDLRQIHDAQELFRAFHLLEGHFEAFSSLMIAARNYQVNHPDDDGGELIDLHVQEALKEELERLYRLEGGKEILEKAQHEALIRLNAYEKHLSAPFNST